MVLRLVRVRAIKTSESGRLAAGEYPSEITVHISSARLRDFFADPELSYNEHLLVFVCNLEERVNDALDRGVERALGWPGMSVVME